VLFRSMAFSNLGGQGLSQSRLASLLYRMQPEYNHQYTYARGTPVMRTDPTGLLVPPGMSSDRDCIKVAEYLIARTWTGPIFGWPPTVLIQCVYYCPPRGSCPPNPEDYYYSKFVEGPELMPGLPRCQPFGKYSDIFPQ